MIPRPQVVRGRLGGRPFLYNPSSYRESVGAEYQEIRSPGISYPIIAYSGGRVRRIEFSLYINGRGLDQGDDAGADYVMEWIAFLKSFLPQAGQRQFTTPPILEFAFGPTVEQTVLESMEPINYTLFTKDLKPLEVTIPISLIVVGG